MEQSLLEMIEKYKKGDKEIFLEIVDKMKPLLNGYVRKLYTWERQDAEQEMVVALLNGIKKMEYLRSEGECIKYACACVRNAYIKIVKKEIKNELKNKIICEKIE